MSCPVLPVLLQWEMDNTLSFWGVKCQNVTAWTWRLLELSGAVNSDEGEALQRSPTWGTRSALMESIS